MLILVSDDDEDETAELQRELEKIKRERAEKREQEVKLSSTAIHFAQLISPCRKEREPPQKRLSGNMTLLLAIPC
jgi:hypothetical protein